MNKIYEYEATVQKVPGIDGAYVEFPYDVKEEFGKGRVKVRATFDGEPYDGSIVNMGVKNSDGEVKLQIFSPRKYSNYVDIWHIL